MVKKKSWQKIKGGVYFIKKEEKEKRKSRKRNYVLKTLSHSNVLIW